MDGSRLYPRLVVALGLSVTLACTPQASSPRQVADLDPPAGGPQRQATVDREHFNAELARLPLHFERNEGQTDAEVDFITRGKGYTLFLTPGTAAFALNKSEGGVLGMHLVGATPEPRAEGLSPLPGKINYYIGGDAERWHDGISTFARVRYPEVYPGIDLIYYGSQRQLEYDLVVAPGANPSAIHLEFSGAESLEVDAQGDLVVRTAGKEARFHKPVVYQDRDGVRQDISGRYVLDGRQVTFEVNAYDASLPLVIDPVFTYGGLVGGDGEDNFWGIAVDPAGNIYASGVSNSLTQNTDTGHTPVVPYPLKNPTQAVCCHGEDTGPAVITKLDPTGSSLVYSTYLGGVAGTDGRAGPCPTPPDCGGAAYYARGWDVSYGIAADRQGFTYATGQAESLFFPTTPDALRKSHPGPSYQRYVATSGREYGDHPRDGWLAKFDPLGKLVYSTLIGGHGSDFGNAVQVVDSGQYQGIYIGGIAQSVDFFSCDTPTGCSNGIGMPAVNTYQRELNVAPCTNLAGGSVLTGCSRAPAPPASCHDAATGATNWACWRDGFVMRLSLDGKTVLLSSMVGSGGDDGVYGIAVDPKTGNIFLSGEAEATDFPITANALQQCHNGNGGYPGDPRLQTVGMAPFACHLSPSPQTSDYPTQTFKPNNDGHLTVFAPNGAVLYSTYLGGTQDDASGAPAGNFTGGQGKSVTLDDMGIAYLTGFTESSTDLTATAHCGPPDPSTGAGTAPCPTQVPFPTTATAYKQDLTTDPTLPPTRRPAHANTWLAKIDITKAGIAGLLYSTYVGGVGDDEAYAVATDNKGGAYVVGHTDSPDFPSKNPLPGYRFINGNPSNTTRTPQYTDAFIYKIDTTKAGEASLIYSTYLGGSADEEARGVAYVDRVGFKGVYVSGFTASDGKPHPAEPGYPGSPTCDALTGAPPGSAVCPGVINAFPTTPGAFQRAVPPSRTKGCTDLSKPDCNTPIPTDPNEDGFIIKIAD